MAVTFKKTILPKITKVIKWTKLVAKCTAIAATITGALTAFTSTSSTVGVAMGAAGATTLAATKAVPTQGYEKTKHIPPGPIKPRAMQAAKSPNGIKLQNGGKSQAGAAKPVRPKMLMSGNTLMLLRKRV